jgi:glycosyltransferase involved in cell wall biosynthesis
LDGQIDINMITNSQPEDIAQKIEFWLNIENLKYQETSKKLQKYVLENHSLEALIEKICITTKK